MATKLLPLSFESGILTETILIEDVYTCPANKMARLNFDFLNVQNDVNSIKDYRWVVWWVKKLASGKQIPIAGIHHTQSTNQLSYTFLSNNRVPVWRYGTNQYTQFFYKTESMSHTTDYPSVTTQSSQAGTVIDSLHLKTGETFQLFTRMNSGGVDAYKAYISGFITEEDVSA